MITKVNWLKYIKRLAAIDKRAGAQMQAWIDEHGLTDIQAAIDYAYGLAIKYGETSATLSAEMYDYMADVMDANVPAAIPAETARMSEIAKALNWARYHSPGQIPSIVGRHVRQAGADTMMQNAKRDKAQWAWVPQGDTCAFCITLASRGWQEASKTVLRGNHAEHIHQNCDCTFAIAFKPADRKKYDYIYDPDRYKQMYDESGGDINAMRRKIYEANKAEINAQKRDLYQVRLFEQSRKKPGNDEEAIISPIIETSRYKDIIGKIDNNEFVSNTILHQGRTTLYHRNGTSKEDMIFINPIRQEWKVQRNYNVDGEVVATEEMIEMLSNSKTKSIIAVHNHPHNNLPSYEDLLAAKSYDYGVVLCHNGTVYKYTVANEANVRLADAVLNELQADLDAGKEYEHHFEMLEATGVKLEMIK